MSISTLAQVMNSKRQTIAMPVFVGSIGAGVWMSQFRLNGGALSNTTTGLVPVAGDTIFPDIVDDAAQNFYLFGIRASAPPGAGGTKAYRAWLHDRLWHAGPISTATIATTTFSGQPSFVSRLPGGTYSGTQLLIEAIGSVVGGNGSISYTNQDGVSGRTTQWTGFSAGADKCSQCLPLQAKDSGVQRVDSITISNSVPGNLNIAIVRPLAMIRVQNPDGLDQYIGFDQIGMPQLYGTSALGARYAQDSDIGFDYSCYFDIDIELMSG